MSNNGNGGLNTNSYISIGLMVTVIGAALWLNNSLNLLSYRMSKIEERQSRPDHPWTGTDMFRWSVELKRLNHGMDVPEPKHKALEQ